MHVWFINEEVHIYKAILDFFWFICNIRIIAFRAIVGLPIKNIRDVLKNKITGI